MITLIILFCIGLIITITKYPFGITLYDREVNFVVSYSNRRFAKPLTYDFCLRYRQFMINPVNYYPEKIESEDLHRTARARLINQSRHRSYQDHIKATKQFVKDGNLLWDSCGNCN